VRRSGAPAPGALNLIGNAIKFTERGEVVVSVRSTSTPGDDLALAFTVSDTGIGIPADKQEAIFQPFTQADTSTTRRFGGTGLGLTICRQLVTLMDGRIWVESEVGSGSRFQFTVRVDRAAARRDSVAVPIGLMVRAVLVVDDNAAARAALERQLAGWGMRPVGVSSGAEAMAQLRGAAAAGQPFALAVVDGSLPDPDGLTIADEIRRRTAGATGVMLLLPPSAAPGTAARAREVGVGRCVSKPVRPTELLRAVGEMLLGLPASAEETPAPVLGGPAGLRVLLVEDNPVNQRVATKVLERAGHQVVGVGNGRLALEAAAGGGFSLALMDVQMPEMDGLEATRLLREREAAGGGRRLPVVAMTAHASGADRDRCLAAGMDDYLTKPVDSGALLAAVARWGGPVRSSDRAADRPGEPVIDLVALATQLGGDEATVDEVLDLFLVGAPGQLETLRSATTSQDRATLERISHAARGGCAQICAGRAARAAAALEQACRAGAPDLLPLCRAFDEELEALRAAVTRQRAAGRPVAAAG
jgi:CheY-like chemotaxis protein/HPt (histidine-containing phosphotransfer) domain-containing protein